MQTQPNNPDVLDQENSVGDSSEHEEPQGDIEEAIAQIWKDLFHLDRIGRNDNFFALGGNSLLGMDLSEMFMTRLALEVPVVMIFQYPTIAEIAQVIASQ